MIDVLGLALLLIAINKNSKSLYLLFIFFYIQNCLHLYIGGSDYWMYYTSGACLELLCIKVLSGKIENLKYMIFNLILIVGNGFGLYLWVNEIDYQPYNIYFVVSYSLLIGWEIKDAIFARLRWLYDNYFDTTRSNCDSFKSTK